MKVLVTGGAGYIGSHTCVELLAAGHDVVVVDDLSNASPAVLERIERITGRRVEFVQARVQDEAQVRRRAFAPASMPSSISPALKAVGESVEQPLRYYDEQPRGHSSASRG